MDEPQKIPDPIPSEDFADPGPSPEPLPPAELSAEISAPQSRFLDQQHDGGSSQDFAARQRSFRHTLFVLLGLTLAAFILTAWILVRVDSPFGVFPTGPQEIVRAQLRALDHGELRPAYDMFSPRYRGQVSFDTWHELFVTHWRMFHAEVVRAETPAFRGPGVTLEIYLHGADDKEYRARFTVVRTDGRWWIDDVHWTQEADERDVSRI
jgi:hypothetical protein